MKQEKFRLYFRKYNHLIVLLSLSFSSFLSFAQTTFFVSENGSGSKDGSSWNNASDDLQLMINTAYSGDQIWVAQGTYYPIRPANNLSVIDKNNRNNAYVLKKDVKLYGGFNGYESALYQRNWKYNVTGLNGNIGDMFDNGDNCYHVVIASGDLGDSCLDGFTVSDGNADDLSGNIVVNGLTIKGESGGGIYIDNSSVKFENLIVNSNSAVSGSGVFCKNSSSIFNLLIVHTNYSIGHGGGVFCENASAEIINTLIYANEATEGGGIYCDNSTYVFLLNSTIASNTAYNKGGGMNVAMLNGSNCIFAQNIAPQGADINLEGAISYGLQNCLVENPNGISEMVDGLNMILYQNPQFMNPASGDYSLYPFSPAINSGDIGFYDPFKYGWLDLGGFERIQGHNIDMGPFEQKATIVNVNYRSGDITICKGGIADIELEVFGDGPPMYELFYDMFEESMYVGSGIWHLHNMGLNSIQVNPTKTTTYELNNIFDGFGNKNPASGSVTITVLPDVNPANGILFVNNNVLISGDGSSWDNAIKEFADALLYANTCGKGLVSEIWVSQGIYFPLYKAAGVDIYNNPTNERDMSFVLPEGVKIYGGFSGIETTLSQRDWKINETILSGDIGFWGDNSDNCYHLIIAAGNLGNTSLDGFIIQDGTSNGTSRIQVNGQEIEQTNGGGIYNSNTSITYVNLTIMLNEADHGGGVYNKNASPTFNKVVIKDNAAIVSGGGAFGSSSNGIFVNTLIYNNYSGFSGAGIIQDGSSDLILNSTIADNIPGSGYGVSFIAGSNPMIQNTIIWGNAIEINSSSPAYKYTLAENENFSHLEGCLDGTDASNNPGFDPEYYPSSAVIGKGSNELYNTLLYGSTDLYGNGRIHDRIDLGAIEMPCQSNPIAIITTPDSSTCGGSISLNIHIEDAVFPCSIHYSDDGANTVHEITDIHDPDFVLEVSPSETITYQLISVKDANGCSNTLSDSVAITVDELIVNPIAGDTEVCVGNIIQLSNTTLNGVWSSDNPTIATVDQDGQVKGISSGIATLVYTVTNNQGCSNFVSTVISVDDCASSPLSAKFASSEVIICSGETAVLTINIIGGTAPYAITYEENGISKTIQDITSNVYLLSVSPVSTTIYALTGIKDNSGLQNDQLTGHLTVRISTPPTIGHLSTPPPVCAGRYLDISKPVTLLNRGIKMADGWILGGKPFNPSTDPISLDDHGKSLVYWIENHCGRTTSNPVVISVIRSSIIIQDIGIGCETVVNLNMAIVSITRKAAVLFYRNPNDSKPIEDPSRVIVSNTAITPFYVKTVAGATQCDNGEFVSFNVIPGKATQKITFGPIENKLSDSPDFDPGATASSGLPVEYTSSDTEVAMIVNGKIHIVGSGETLITALQPGNACFLPAEIVTQLLIVQGDDDPLLTDVIINGQDWADLYQAYVICDYTKKFITINLDVVPGATIDKGQTLVIDVSGWGIKVIRFTVTSKSKKEFYTLYIDKRIPFSQVVKMRWNNTFGIVNNPLNNGDYRFVSYKWFRNEQEVSTEPYFSINNQEWSHLNSKDLYRVQVTTDKGETINSCYWDGILDDFSVMAYPNPADKGEIIYVEAELGEDALANAFIELYNISGSLVEKMKVTGKITQITAPTVGGVYVVKFTAENNYSRSLKVIIKE